MVDLNKLPIGKTLTIITPNSTYELRAKFVVTYEDSDSKERINVRGVEIIRNGKIVDLGACVKLANCKIILEKGESFYMRYLRVLDSGRFHKSCGEYIASIIRTTTPVVRFGIF